MGCEVRSLGEAPTGYGVRTVGAVRCADGWHAARFLVAMAAEDARGPLARRLAGELRAAAGPDDLALLVLAHRFVRERVRFERERGEVFTSLDYTLRTGVGDCDDHARVLFAVLGAAGLPVRLGFLAKELERGPVHVVAQAFVRGRWWWLETTIAAAVGEHPVTAGKRLGILDDRVDIAGNVEVFMSENDLPPVPPNLSRSSSAAELARDAEALGRLGYYDGAPPPNALETRFRRAVLAFQRDRGLLADGLTGPVTRAAMARALVERGQTECGGGPFPGMGAAVPIVHSAHLSDGFFQGVRDMAARLRAFGVGASARDFLAVWFAESRLRPDAGGRGWPAVGLHQILVTSLPSVGWRGTVDEYRALSAEDQLPYVERWYLNLGPLLGRVDDVGSLYLANFLPALLPGGAAPDRELVRRGGTRYGGQEAIWYRDNAGLDVGNDGAITVGDLVAAVERAQRFDRAYWSEVEARLGEGRARVLEVSGVAGALVALGAGAAAAWHFVA